MHRHTLWSQPHWATQDARQAEQRRKSCLGPRAASDFLLFLCSQSSCRLFAFHCGPGWFKEPSESPWMWSGCSCSRDNVTDVSGLQSWHYQRAPWKLREGRASPPPQPHFCCFIYLFFNPLDELISCPFPSAECPPKNWHSFCLWH